MDAPDTRFVPALNPVRREIRAWRRADIVTATRVIGVYRIGDWFIFWRVYSHPLRAGSTMQEKPMTRYNENFELTVDDMELIEKRLAPDRIRAEPWTD